MLYTEDFSMHHCVGFSQIGSHIAQAGSSFKHLDTCTFMYVTPTLITEALCLLVIRVQLLLTIVTVN